MGVNKSTVPGQYGAIALVLFVALLAIACQSERTVVVVPYAGRWVRPWSWETKPRGASSSSSPGVIYPWTPGLLGSQTKLTQLVFNDDGTSVRYISATDAEVTYRVGPDTLCYVDTTEPYCLLWKFDGDRVLLCDQPGGDCRIFVRPEALPVLINNSVSG